MRAYNRTLFILLCAASSLFIISFALLIVSGIDPRLAFVWNVLSSLDINFNFLPATAASQPLVLLASLLDAFTFAVVAVALATMFFDGIKQLNLTKRVVLSRVRRIKQHIIMVPYNSFAQSLSKELEANGQKIVIITDSEAEARKLYKRGELAIVADPKDIESFKAAGIERARYVVACSDEDIQNALIIITAKTANSRAKIISRANDFDNVPRLRTAGAYRMIMPEVSTGIEIGEEIIKRAISQ